MTLGIVGAMPEEVEKIFEVIVDKKKTERGNRTYYQGTINGTKVVSVFSRWGKVAAATTITSLILEFKVDHILFVGIAGSISDNVHIGDIVVAKRLYQHDMDARPLMNQFEIPLTGQTYFELAQNDIATGVKAVERFFKNETGKVTVGDIATGDLFVCTRAMRNQLNHALPTTVCADMESAAVAQVCADYNTPLCVIRAISDNADETANEEAINFVEKYGGKFLFQIALEYINELNK